MTDLIAQHLAQLRAAALSDRTIVDRGRVLRRLDRELPLGVYEATVEELQNWLGRPGWSRQTKATYYGHIRGFYRWASDPDRTIGLEYDPSEGLIRPKVPTGKPRPIASEELAHARTNLANPWRLYVELAAFAGLRAVEISRLDRRDVTKEQLVVRRGKGDKTRTVFTSPDLWHSVQPLPHGPIARTVRGGRLSAHETSSRTAEALDRIGLPDVTLHRCRHWYATYLLDGGAEVTAVQDAMGHGSLGTTAVYLLLTSGQRMRLRRAVHALSALAPTPS